MILKKLLTQKMKNAQVIKIRKTIKTIFLMQLVLLLAFSCNTPKKDSKTTKYNSVQALEAQTNENSGLQLLQQNCYACHSVTSTSHDAIIAPPMAVIKRRYLMSYSSKEEFVEAITKWTLDPTEGNALMRGAVQNFNVMPKQPFNKETVTSIVTYIYENELEEPAWLQDQFNSQHSNGMGHGMNNGNGQGRGGIIH